MDSYSIKYKKGYRTIAIQCSTYVFTSVLATMVQGEVLIRVLKTVKAFWVSQGYLIERPYISKAFSVVNTNFEY